MFWISIFVYTNTNNASLFCHPLNLTFDFSRTVREKTSTNKQGGCPCLSSLSCLHANVLHAHEKYPWRKTESNWGTEVGDALLFIVVLCKIVIFPPCRVHSVIVSTFRGTRNCSPCISHFLFLSAPYVIFKSLSIIRPAPRTLLENFRFHASVLNVPILLFHFNYLRWTRYICFQICTVSGNSFLSLALPREYISLCSL